MNNMYLRLDIRVMSDEFLAFQYFRNKSEDYLYLYIKNLKTPNLKPCFGTIYPFEFAWAGNKF